MGVLPFILIPAYFTLILGFYTFYLCITSLITLSYLGRAGGMAKEMGRVKDFMGLCGFAVFKSFLEQSVAVVRRMREWVKE